MGHRGMCPVSRRGHIPNPFRSVAESAPSSYSDTLLAGRGLNAHAQSARAVVLEPDESIREGEEGVVLGQPDVLPWLPFGAVLAEDDRPAADRLTAEALDPEPLGIAVAPVAARALPFLVRHGHEPRKKLGAALAPLAWALRGAHPTWPKPRCRRAHA